MRRASRATSSRARSAASVGVVGGDAGDQIARERAARLGEPEERPGALALPLGEPGVDQQLQMARDARLRLAEDADEFADRQLGLAEQAEQAQPRHFAGGLEGGEQGVEGERERVRKSDIKICLCLFRGPGKGQSVGAQRPVWRRSPEPNQPTGARNSRLTTRRDNADKAARTALKASDKREEFA